MLTSVGSEILSGLLDDSLDPVRVVWCWIISLEELLWDCTQLSLEVLVLGALATLPLAALLLLFVLDADECAGEENSFADWAKFCRKAKKY